MAIIVSAAIIQQGSLLVVKRDYKWIPPCAKKRENESEIEAICRRFSDDFHGNRLKVGDLYKKFDYPNNPGMPRSVNKVYFAEVEGDITPDYYKLKHIAWFSHAHHANISDMTREIMDSLKEKSLIY